MMKILLTFAFACFGCLVFAQDVDSTNSVLHKKLWFIGLTASFDFTEVTGENFTKKAFRVVPEANKVISDHIIMGAGIGYSYRSDVSNFKARSFVSRLNIRFVQRIEDKVLFFAQAEMSFEHGAAEIDQFSDLNSPLFEFNLELYSAFQVYQISMRPGVMYIPTNRWLVECYLDFFSFNKFNFNDNVGRTFIDTNSLQFKLDLSRVSMGVKYIF